MEARPTLPGNRVTRIEMKVGDPHLAEMKEKDKKICPGKNDFIRIVV